MLNIQIDLECYRAIYLPVPAIERQSVLQWLTKNLGGEQKLPVYLGNLSTAGYQQLLPLAETDELKVTQAVDFAAKDYLGQMIEALTSIYERKEPGVFILEHLGIFLSHPVHRRP